MAGLNGEIKNAVVTCGQQTAKDAERAAIVLIHFAEAFGASVEQLKEALMHVAESVGNLTSMSTVEAETALNCMQPQRQVIKPIHKLNFNRPKIIHQVSNRRPRHLVKKIIR